MAGLLGVFSFPAIAAEKSSRSNINVTQSDSAQSLQQSLEHILSSDYLKNNAYSTGFITIPDAGLQVMTDEDLLKPANVSRNQQAQQIASTAPSVEEPAPPVNDFYTKSYPVQNIKKSQKIIWKRRRKKADDNEKLASTLPVSNQQVAEPDATLTPPITNQWSNSQEVPSAEERAAYERSVHDRYEQDPRFYQVYQYIREFNKNLSPAEVKLIARAIADFSVHYNVDHRVVTSVIAVESSFRRDAISSSGAIGLGQLKPATARWLGVNNPYDPVDNVGGCAKYIAMLSKKYNGNLSKALSAYYQGPGTIDRGGINDAARYYLTKIQKALRGFAS